MSTDTGKRYETGEDFDASEGLLLVSEVADMYKVDHKTALRWARTGLIPHIRTAGNHYRLSVAYHRRHLAARDD